MARVPDHSPQRIAEIQGALAASVREYQGRMLPRFKSVAKQFGISDETCRQIWHSRMKHEERTLAVTGAITRDAAAASRGFEEWLTRCRGLLMDRIAENLEDVESWQSADPDTRARAHRATAQTFRELRELHAPVTGDDETDRAVIEARIRRALERERD